MAAPPGAARPDPEPDAAAPALARGARLLSLRRIDEAIAVTCMLAIVFSIAWGVVTRYLFPQPASWTFETAVIAFGWLVFFGSAACIRWRMHADVDALVAQFPPAVRRAIFIFNWFLLAALFIVLAAMFAWQAVLSHEIRVVSLDIPRSVVYAPMAVASLLMLVQHVLLAPWRGGWQWRPSSEQAV
jgi:TRAP-type C4-dicarboxylate transport system permease small subunit